MWEPIRWESLLNKRNLFFGASMGLTGWMLYRPYQALWASSDAKDYYSHILLIPLVSACLIYWRRREIFRNLSSSITFGLGLLLGGLLLCLTEGQQGNPLNPNDHAFWQFSGGFSFLLGSFLLVYGRSAFERAIFPLLFLAFMVPIPSIILEPFILFLQVGSTEVTQLLFRLLGLPFLREGFLFQLPGINIEVAKQCSGIRSSLALIITGILAGHFFLEKGWKRAVLILAIFPITLFKNGVRIVTLTLLAVYVDERFLTQGFLHRSGGFVFFIPSLVLMGYILWLLRHSERR